MGGKSCSFRSCSSSSSSFQSVGWFEKYGFVLLKHESKMSACGWEESERSLDSLVNPGSDKNTDDFNHKDTPVKSVYAKEAESILKQLMPNAIEVFTPAQG